MSIEQLNKHVAKNNMLTFQESQAILNEKWPAKSRPDLHFGVAQVHVTGVNLDPYRGIRSIYNAEVRRGRR